MSLYRCHDYAFLLRRWKKAARAAGLEWRAIGEADGYEVYCATTRGAVEAGGVYISAGIHGDEPAGTEALIRWAEANPASLRAQPYLIFPCLNPWGLVNNARLDASGNDLNRTFHHEEVPHIQHWKTLLKGRKFSLALTLHEDYDGEGLYLYEIGRNPPHWGEELLELARPHIEIEARVRIDGRRITKPGLFRRRVDLRRFPQLPEALYLHLHHARRTFTFETPSEFALETRVRVQQLLIHACTQRALAV